MLANELIDRLERGGLLDQEIIEALREQLDQGTRVTPEAVAKLLVDNGQLTRFQATKLIGELRSGEYEQTASVEVMAGMEDLAILPEDALDDVVEVSLVDDAPVDVYAEPVTVEAVPVEAVPVEAVPVDGGGRPSGGSRPQRARPQRQEEKSVWDSFKIYGYAGILGLLCLSGYGLYYMLTRQSADEFIEQCRKLYDQANFTGAQDSYTSFLKEFGEEHPFASEAKVKITMCEFYRAKDMTDPTRGLELLKEKLPSIENEPGLNDERENLAGLLVDIAAEIARVAQKETVTEEKEKLLGSLDEQLALMDNPNYMSSTMKVNLEGQLTAIHEARQRVRRDINRNVRLDESVASMDKLLEEQKTKEAYEVRFQLLREFPELHDNERVMELIGKASGIQKTLVKPATELPESIEETAAESKERSIVLTTVEGTKAPDLLNQIYYLRAGGSVLAFAADTGNLLWRKFVGYGQDHLPVRLEDGSGVLLSDIAKLAVERVDGKDGKVRWRMGIGEPFSEPISERDDVYVSAHSGRLAKMEASTGDVGWVAQIPQELEVGPGIDSRAKIAYIPGDHSNLYLINTRDGSCVESYYIGHAKGTIQVPPLPLLGHLFVFENAGMDFTRVHILKVNPQGTGVEVAQPAMRFAGNVKIKPILQDQRRMIVLTDLGQVSVLDVEPTKATEQVSVVAEQASSYDQPTATQMAVGNSQMWITGTRIGRYELQVSKGRVVPDKFNYDTDRFIGQPYTAGDTLVHARILRGTDAIRVTAAEAKSGREIWRTDVGVPISMIVPIDGKPAFHVVTTQGTLFELGRESLVSGSTPGPIENPGGNGVAMRFENPFKIDATRRLMLNQATPGEVIIYDPTRARELLRRIKLNYSDKTPGGAVVAGGGLLAPLDSGRVVLMDWQRGTMLGAPFQPPSAPEAEIGWTNPIALQSDPNQVVVADSRKTIYRLRAGDQVTELAKKTLENPFLKTIAQVGKVIVGSIDGPSADYIVGHSVDSLDETFKVLLEGRINYGPIQASDQFCLIRTNDSVLRAIGEDGKQVFEVPIPEGIIVGEPLFVNSKMILVGKSGWMVAIDAPSGKLLGKSDLGQPISATPLSVASSLLVPGGEGVIYITSVPSELE